MTNADLKAAIRDRMASTGENYTTAKRAIELARLKAQSEQPDSTLAEQRTRTLNERFDTVAEQLGSDKPPAVRLAAVYAMAGLADDWQDHRQTCVDVLCAYLRMPYEPEPGDDAPVEKRLAFQASREVRHTVIRVIAAHLNGTASVSWCGLNFDFAGAVFDGGDFSDAKFSGGTVNFVGAEFSGGAVNFAGAKFSGAGVNFFLAKFSGAKVNFAGAKFSGGTAGFGYAEFSCETVNFTSAKFSGAEVRFFASKFTGESPKFTGAGTSGGMVFFHAAEFSGGTVIFSRAEFSSETVDFAGAEFSGGTVGFADAEFPGGTVGFAGARFSGGTVDFSRVASWTRPPDFGSGFDMSHPPAGVIAPRQRLG
ncbi:MAG TPA: pentapeptide repeat-containing protein [Streptosporangiaceae bacterium]|nr:pentapeptide repeat-containing protein [Streptosporangiaceae bacterium]